MYNNYYQPYPQLQRRPMKCYPVSSFEEVRSAMIDFDGSITLFTDIANGNIYTKQIINDGTAEIRTYTLQQNNVPEPLESRVARLEEMIGGLYGRNAVDENGTGQSESNGNDKSVKRK